MAAPCSPGVKRTAATAFAVASSDAAAHGVTSSTAARAGLKLDERTESMTVEQFLRSYLADMCDKANAVVDGAIDDVSLLYKQLREETQNYRHQKRAEEHARNKAARKKVWDVQLTVEETAEGNEAMLGQVFVVCPRQKRHGDQTGMCKVGRSSGDDFKGTRGISLPTDYSVSTWHGKFTSVWGTVYYTDLNTKNGSRLNGERIERDTPVAIKSSDTLSLGDTRLRVVLIPATATEEDALEEAVLAAASTAASNTAPAPPAAPPAAATGKAVGRTTRRAAAAASTAVEGA